MISPWPVTVFGDNPCSRHLSAFVRSPVPRQAAALDWKVRLIGILNLAVRDDQANREPYQGPRDRNLPLSKCLQSSANVYASPLGAVASIIILNAAAVGMCLWDLIALLAGLFQWWLGEGNIYSDRKMVR